MPAFTTCTFLKDQGWFGRSQQESSTYTGHTGTQQWLSISESLQSPISWVWTCICRRKLKHGSHGSLGKLCHRWSMHVQTQYHHSINSACCDAYIPNVLLLNLLCGSIWDMEISWWISASGRILENSQQQNKNEQKASNKQTKRKQENQNQTKINQPTKT